MKVFLDIDGVMVHAIPSQAIKLIDDGFYEFDKESVSAFNQFFRSKNIEVILTTSHRFKYNEQDWLRMLQQRGLKIFKLTRMDKSNNNWSRKLEIYAHMLNHKLEPDEVFVIDDDKSLNGCSLNKIQPSPLYGLRFTDINEKV